MRVAQRIEDEVEMGAHNPFWFSRCPGGIEQKWNLCFSMYRI